MTGHHIFTASWFAYGSTEKVKGTSTIEMTENIFDINENNLLKETISPFCAELPLHTGDSAILRVFHPTRETTMVCRSELVDDRITDRGSVIYAHSLIFANKDENKDKNMFLTAPHRAFEDGAHESYEDFVARVGNYVNSPAPLSRLYDPKREDYNLKSSSVESFLTQYEINENTFYMLMAELNRIIFHESNKKIALILKKGVKGSSFIADFLNVIPMNIKEKLGVASNWTTDIDTTKPGKGLSGIHLICYEFLKPKDSSMPICNLHTSEFINIVYKDFDVDYMKLLFDYARDNHKERELNEFISNLKNKISNLQYDDLVKGIVLHDITCKLQGSSVNNLVENLSMGFEIVCNDLYNQIEHFDEEVKLLLKKFSDSFGIAGEKFSSKTYANVFKLLSVDNSINMDSISFANFCLSAAVKKADVEKLNIIQDYYISKKDSLKESHFGIINKIYLEEQPVVTSDEFKVAFAQGLFDFARVYRERCFSENKGDYISLYKEIKEVWEKKLGSEPPKSLFYYDANCIQKGGKNEVFYALLELDIETSGFEIGKEHWNLFLSIYSEGEDDSENFDSLIIWTYENSSEETKVTMVNDLISNNNTKFVKKLRSLMKIEASLETQLDELIINHNISIIAPISASDMLTTVNGERINDAIEKLKSFVEEKKSFDIELENEFLRNKVNELINYDIILATSEYLTFENMIFALESYGEINDCGMCKFIQECEKSFKLHSYFKSILNFMINKNSLSKDNSNSEITIENVESILVSRIIFWNKLETGQPLYTADNVLALSALKSYSDYFQNVRSTFESHLKNEPNIQELIENATKILNESKYDIRNKLTDGKDLIGYFKNERSITSSEQSEKEKKLEYEKRSDDNSDNFKDAHSDSNKDTHNLLSIFDKLDLKSVIVGISIILIILVPMGLYFYNFVESRIMEIGEEKERLKNNLSVFENAFTVSENDISLYVSRVGFPIPEIDLSAYVAGGELPYYFSGSGLPDGIRISSDGIISGFPTLESEGGIAFVTVTDRTSTNRHIRIRYAEITSLSIDVKSIIAGAAIENINTSDMLPPYMSSYTFEARDFPAGIYINDYGIIYGVPLEDGGRRTSKVVVTYRGSESFYVSVEFDEIRPALPLVFTNSDAFNIPKSAQSIAIESINVLHGVTGGFMPYTFTSENLPAGIVISVDGIISGIPAEVRDAGSAYITITDNAGEYRTIQINYGEISTRDMAVEPNEHLPTHPSESPVSTTSFRINAQRAFNNIYSVYRLPPGRYGEIFSLE